MKKEKEANSIQEYGAGYDKMRRGGRVAISKTTTAKKTPDGWQVTKTKTKTTKKGTVTKTKIKNKKNVKMVSKTSVGNDAPVSMSATRY